MQKLIINKKAFRKKMIDLNIKTINELSSKSGVSKPTIYDYLNGKSPFSTAFIKLCNSLKVNPNDILINQTEENND